MKYTDESIRPIQEVAIVRERKIILTNATKTRVKQARDWIRAEMTRGTPLEATITKLISLRSDIMVFSDQI
jgi:hypothetical protein